MHNLFTVPDTAAQATICTPVYSPATYEVQETAAQERSIDL